MQKQKVPYLRGVQQEIRKISWTSKEELLTGAKVVIVSTFVFALAIYAADVLVHQLLFALGNLTYLIFG